MLIKFNELWLRQWIKNLTCDSETLSEQLINLGFEVESKELISLNYNNFLIGKIISTTKYKKPLKLMVVKVNIGQKNLNIITNYQKCIKNSKVIIAKKIIDDNNVFHLCSYSDLCIKDSSNIVILPKDSKIFDNPNKYFQIKDFSYKVNITANRSDCLSIIGIARDLAAFNKTYLKKRKTKKIIPTLDLQNKICLKTDKFPLYWINYNFCIIKNISIKTQTPLWIKEKLIRSKIQYSDNILSNIYNYILTEYGQPIFFFDFDKIDSFIHIRMAKEKEIFKLSKEKNIILNNKTLVISDKKKVISIAGIIKSMYADINTHTKNIIIDCSFFHPSIILGQTNVYKLPVNEISYRYERGIDPFIQHEIIEKVVNLILKICGGQASSIITNIDNFYFKKSLKKLNKNIKLTKNKLYKLLGFIISDKEVLNILKRLGFKILKLINKTSWLIQIPSWRFDIFIEEDLIEEIIRLYGYNNIPDIDLLSKSNISFHNKYHNIKLHEAKNTLIEKGYQEIITYSFVNPKHQKILHPKKIFLTLKNPISLDMSTMRLSMFSGLISTLIYNQNRKKNRIRLFESGICFLPINNEKKINIRQELILSAIISGNCYNTNWNLPSRNVDFYDIKADIESLLDKQNNLDYLEFKNEKNISLLHPEQSAIIYLNKKNIGIIGAIHPSIKKKLKIKNNFFLFEIIWKQLSNFSSEKKIKKISKLPIINRDISFLINKNFSAQKVIKECKKFFFINKIDLIDINIFDVYQNKKFDDKYKSFSINLIIQNNKKNLEEKEINEIILKCLDNLKKIFNILIRDKIY